ncbi:RidA family protein [Xanthomonas campestris]|uniref:TdcF protein n=2 Tax=Xanthomonas campestris pv. campestris TaxID=340 RepID=Q8P5R0_XANCP|nr:RidA family protein [Xanthomonas campestris]AAM42546.1 TdcF protein [Xanthomonas campestris pv. campestris str. ATCC 33913]AAY47962.1 TdcF protein [Xanthomonas campestris pv. campestris str. 8004]AKS15222.1 endoribonuclease L-PSP [Xanthomonas campestris pv. campestris]AKS19250.1 endoribonuclease L-PSP [Xanthomonas campestris pv. campestris]ALE69855.1 endoribonuclease L-PSP [Xanthomonas campestris pv. campestris]
MFRPAVIAATAAVLWCGSVAAAQAAEVIRHKIPNSDFPIAAAVEVPAGKATVYVSGKVPAVVDTTAPKGSAAAYGDTNAQTISVLAQIKQQLESLGLGMGDVVKMQVFLVGDPAMDGKMDFNGFMEGYRQYFGTKEQPNLPARSAFQIAALGNPLYRVEIEVVAVRP